MLLDRPLVEPPLERLRPPPERVLEEVPLRERAPERPLEPPERFRAPPFRALPDDERRDGTFAPFSRASERPIAIACSGLSTVPPCPALPRRSVPRFRRRIALATLFDAALPYRRPLVRFVPDFDADFAADFRPLLPPARVLRPLDLRAPVLRPVVLRPPVERDRLVAAMRSLHCRGESCDGAHRTRQSPRREWLSMATIRAAAVQRTAGVAR